MRKDRIFTWPSINKVIWFRITNFYFRHQTLPFSQPPNVQRSAAAQGNVTNILPEIPEAHSAIRAKRLVGRLQRTVGRFMILLSYIIIPLPE
jgi:hypothetical protein